MNPNLAPVPLPKAYRLLNHGPTTLVSSQHLDCYNVMAASWVCALDINPPKLTAVLDGSTKTRELIDHSNYFIVQIPTLAQKNLVQYLGTYSRHEHPQKLQESGLKTFSHPNFPCPLVEGCAAWLLCKVVPHPEVQQAHDLFLAEITEAWADTRIFRDGRWHFESEAPSWRSLHHVAGGHFYAIGEAMKAPSAQTLS